VPGSNNKNRYLFCCAPRVAGTLRVIQVETQGIVPCAFTWTT